MKPEEFFETLSDIDENMVAKAKPFAEEETVEPIMVTPPQKRSFKAFYPAAACLGVVALGAAVMLIANNMNRGVDLPYSTGEISLAESTSEVTETTEITEGSDISDLGYKTLGQYPENTDYVFTEDLSTVNIAYPIIDYGMFYKSYQELAEDSLMVVEGTLIDDTRQSSVKDLYNGKGHYVSFNTLEVTKVLKGEDLVSEGDRVVIAQSYAYEKVIGADRYQMNASSYLTPMTKGDKWIYFLYKVNSDLFDCYRVVGDFQGRYPVPNQENQPFAYHENVNGVVEETFNNYIYNQIQVMFYGGDANSLVQYNQNYAYPYTGDYSEITEFDKPYNILGIEKIGSYEELAAESDLIVKGRFIDDPHQMVEPNPPPDIPLGANIFSQCKFEIEQVIQGDAKVGDVVIINQSIGVYGGKLISTSQLTPMVKGDQWIYFLKVGTGDSSCWTVNDSDGRYLPPNCTTNFDFSALGYDNNLGYSYGEYFNEKIYNELLQAMNGETAPVTNPEGNPNTDPPESTDTVFKVFDVIADKNDYSTDRINFKMEEFPGVTFARCVDVNSGQYVEAVMGDGSVYTLWDGWPVESIYLCDLNGDGKREICSTVFMGSGLVDSRVYACDFENKQCYELSDRGNYDFCLKCNDNKLMVSKFNYNSMGFNELFCHELSLSAMTCHDGTIHHEEGHTHNTAHHEEEHPVVTTHHYEDHHSGHH